MTPEQHTLALKYLMQRLQPEEQEELKSLLGDKDMPDLAEDAIKGRIAMDRLPPRLQRVAVSRLKRPGVVDAEADFLKRFPDAGRLKVR